MSKPKVKKFEDEKCVGITVEAHGFMQAFKASLESIDGGMLPSPASRLSHAMLTGIYNAMDKECDDHESVHPRDVLNALCNTVGNCITNLCANGLKNGMTMEMVRDSFIRDMVSMTDHIQGLMNAGPTHEEPEAGEDEALDNFRRILDEFTTHNRKAN